MDMDEVFAKGQATFHERNKAYGDSYKEHGSVMGSLFPEGVTLTTDEDFIRFGLVNSMMTKMKRYTNSFNNPHEDSTLDLMVYAGMLHEIDHEIIEQDKTINAIVSEIRRTIDKVGENVDAVVNVTAKEQAVDTKELLPMGDDDRKIEPYTADEIKAIQSTPIPKTEDPAPELEG